MLNWALAQSATAEIRLPPGTETGQTPPNKTSQQQQKQLLHSQLQPARPYTRIQLTVEPDSFVLQPYHDPLTATADVSAAHKDNATTDLVQILFRVPGIDAERDSEEQIQTELDAEGQINKEKANTGPDGSSSFSGLTEGQNGRVSFLAPGSYTRSENAKDYIIYGCIGLLDLYTGPHFIVITSVKPLGDIEDKPVYAIKKVAVLPMDEQESRQVLDRLAQWIDLSTGPVAHIQQPSDQQGSIQESLADEEVKEEQPSTPVAPRSPKVKFSFLGLRQDKDMQKSSSSSSLPTVSKSMDLNRDDVVVTAASPPSSKRISFDIPQLGFGNRSSTNLSVSTNPTNESNSASGSTISSLPSSPLLSPKTRSPQPGFFAKFKESVLDKKPRKSLDGDTPAASITEDKGSLINSVESVDEQTRINDDATIVAPAPALMIDLTQVGKNGGQSPSGPKSPSAFEAAEKFMIDSTKQLANWSEEAVTGVLKSTTSFTLSRSTPEAGEQEQDENTKSTNNMSEDPQTKEDELEKSRMLDRRVIREISSIFGNGFYFSTEFNLLSSKQKRFDFARDTTQGSTPLWQQVDKRFWWNEHLLKEFLEIEADGYILPVMQGYVEVEQCVIEEQPFEFTLISRRSRERSGLRYQRRGIDDDGNTANFVETEQLLRIVRDESDHQVSFVQTRGSIPLFWSQSPYRLKPIPIMERSEQENEEGFKKHFDGLIKQYGRQICINLVEKHARELIAGSAYTRNVEKLAEPQVRYVEFDFHEQCKGMKYENIERLIKNLEAPILELGYCWLAPRSDRATQKRDESFERLYDQKGVVRTNCMDCLDRTNVVQSAIGRYILNHQLLRLGIASFPDKGLSVYEDFENIFNNVWANNGDAISREYAGTSALKGDFTRTGKRNLQGMINDATNSMARMYQNTFKDFFRQAAIDYLLGAADVNVFKNLQTTPFGTSSDEKAMQQDTWVKIREAAIETSAEIVISPGEEQWKGWTKSSSKSDNNLMFYDEKVVLLTERALYICTYDYDMEKVLEFWRLALEKMTGIDKGAYFLTAQDKSRQGQSPLENYGFSVLYRANAGGETLRVNSGSVRN
ncbi:SacI homology domain-containing protein, partial [Dissophora ornata]